MNKELLEAIDNTIQLICKNIQKSLSNINDSHQISYPNESIKSLAELILARASLEKDCHYSSDSFNE